jgi:pre-mRNA-splicing helicase BRR2
LYFNNVQNSNLVLTAEQRTSGVGKEPDGSAQSLWKNMVGQMGDRVQQTKPDVIEKKRRVDGPGESDVLGSKRTKHGAGLSVLDMETAGLYRPKTKETRAAYETLLSSIRSMFGDAPHDVLCGAADEVLATLKNDTLKDPERQAEISSLLGQVSNEKFAEFIAIGKLITDFTTEDAMAASVAAGGNAMDEELGVAVEFEDDEEEEDDQEGLVGTVIDDEDADEFFEGGANAVRAVAADGGDVDEGSNGDLIPVQEIDAFWLQRRVSKAYDSLDPMQAQKIAEDVFEALQLKDLREVENKLVMLLDFERFDLVKELLQNKDRIVWCMRLARAEDEEEKASVEREMEPSAEGRAVLHALKGTRASARDRENAVEKSIREEARKLRRDDAGGTQMAQQTSQRKNIDLEALKFAEEGHMNTNKATTLPQGSYRTVHKGYEEVHVPALKAKPFAKGEKLKEIKELPEWAQAGFKGMKSLNRIQSRVYETALFSSENMLVCAPTGAGKTNVAMLTMLHEIGLHRQPDGTIDTSAFKMIYVAPMKALVAEMVGNFSKRLGPYGINVRELTGDISLTKAEIEDTQLIIVTPEKWDIITRKSGERAYTQAVRLVIIDEIHLLHDSRGPVLECLVARTLRQIESTQEMVRLVGLSATLPNFEDVAAFLRVSPEKGLFHFDNSFRPCPLAQQYIGITVKKPLQRFQLMNEICYEKVMESAGKHQVLIFVHSRKETAKTARFLKDEALRNETLMNILKDDSASREILQTEAESVKSSDLKALLPFGLGIHHAGMTRADRTLVEDLFADGHIQVLVSTATLAWGVNLPAHTVIIKGTQIYNPVKSAWTELSPLDVMQMFGRAGRPQYDTFGEGIIITSHSELQFYLSLFNMQLPVESQLVGTLANNLNAEIVLGTVQNIEDAAAWLGYTYFYVRMLCEPQLYGVPLDAADSDPVLQVCSYFYSISWQIHVWDMKITLVYVFTFM